MPSAVKTNIAANFIGRIWASLMTLLFVPLYIQFLGVEAYGLVGFYASLKAVSSIFDFGLSTTLNREVARHTGSLEGQCFVSDTIRSLEVVYWLTAMVIFVFVGMGSPLIAGKWIKASSFSPEMLTWVVVIMGGVLALQFPFALYMGGLRGLQKHVHLNGIHVFAGTLRSVGTVIVLWKISPTIHTFFLCQALVALVETVLTMACFWRLWPGRFLKASFRLENLRSIWKFAAGITMIGVTGIALSQMDRLILIKTIPLETFGLYSIALAAATGIQSVIVYPISNAVFPRFSQLITDGGGRRLAAFYHKSSQLVSLLILPAGVTIIVFSREILELWIRNQEIANGAGTMLSILMAAYAINSIGIIPQMMQLASGWTKLTATYNALAVIALVPAVAWASSSYGARGAATVYLFLFISYLGVVVPLMHRRILKGEFRRWLMEDVGAGMFICVISLPFMYFIKSHVSWPPLLLIGMFFVSLFCATAILSGRIRKGLFEILNRTFRNH